MDDEPVFHKKTTEVEATSLCDDIYPLQSPYGDIQGLTPPPDEYSGFNLAVDCRFNQKAEPPTPPRTEVVSSPARSSTSSGSLSRKESTGSPPTNPTTPDSYAGMDQEPNLTGPPLNPGVSHQDISFDFDTTTTVSEMDIVAEGDVYFDWDSAASSPKPSEQFIHANTHNEVSRPGGRCSSARFRRTDGLSFSGYNFGDTARMMRKRSRDSSISELESDCMFTGIPTQDVKTEQTLGAPDLGGMNNLEHQSVFNYPQSSVFTLATAVSVTPVARNFSSPATGDFSPQFELAVDFPKHNTRPPEQVKSRVETQIPVRFMLAPAPNGISKLRLPRHTISKIKYIEDSVPRNCPDTLELDATLVCASAMAVEDQLQRALYEARGESLPEWIIEEQNKRLTSDRASAGGRQSDTPGSTPARDSLPSGKEDKRHKVDFNTPLFGASVQICEQCMNRERKRASRKKNKKPEEEQKWAQDEKKRIIVFNTNQIRQFEDMMYPDGSRAIVAETQMRICCYCRHHGEKDGFRVIFTMTDHTGKVVAQTISSTIVITDDHKNTSTTAPPTLSPTSSAHHDGILGSSAQRTFQTSSPLRSAASTISCADFNPLSYSNSGMGIRTNGHPSGTPSRTPGSPAAHQTKRRKSNKLPAGLAMTPSDSQHNLLQSASSRFAGAPLQDGQTLGNWVSNRPTPLSQLNFGHNESYRFGAMGWNTAAQGSPAFAMSKSPALVNLSPGASQPYTPQDLSPISRQTVPAYAQGQAAEVKRVVPSEGTCRGGIDVTVLGSGFVDGLTVMFGDNPATDTICYSESTLLCRLPPNPVPGPVVVALKNLESNPRPPNTQPIIFNYVDDVEKELLSLALTVVGMKMKGEAGSSRQIALSILRDNGVGSEAMDVIRSGIRSNQLQELEPTLLACLETVDMDDSPHPARLNLKNGSGQTMLHLSAIMGLQKFTAALIARGAKLNNRDRNGYTPLHFAALHKRPDIVRRLLISKANAGIRTRNGDTAADLDESDHIVRATRSVQQSHSRQHSRSNSLSSESRLAASSLHVARDAVDAYYESSNDDDTAGDSAGESAQQSWATSRRSSLNEIQAQIEKTALKSAEKGSSSVLPPRQGPQAPSSPIMMAAWMDAWREQLMQSLQNWHLNIPTIPTAGDYQTLFQNPMARFQYPAMKWNALRPPFAQQPDGADHKDPDYKWSELFHPPVPPAYEDLYPASLADSKASASASSPQKIAVTTMGTSEINRSGSPQLPLDLKELQRQIASGDRHLSAAQQAEYIAHIRKLKRIESDRRLYFFWIPILLVMLITVAFNRGPKAWASGKLVFGVIAEAFRDPLSLRERLLHTGPPPAVRQT